MTTAPKYIIGDIIIASISKTLGSYEGKVIRKDLVAQMVIEDAIYDDKTGAWVYSNGQYSAYEKDIKGKIGRR